ncbi:MAG: hypothetical protein R3E97_11975 [Candidatus Eisenbacteria bacterium]
MSLLPRMRPDFVLDLEVDGEQVLETLRRKLAKDDAPFEGQVLKGHACLRLPPKRRSMLSPFLEIDTKVEDGKEVIHGRFSPAPNVWTGFMALFGTIAMLGLAGTIYGLAKITLGGGLLWLLSGPAAIALIAFVYGAAFIGQGLSSQEMFDLRAYVQCIVRDLQDENYDGSDEQPHRLREQRASGAISAE